MSSSFGRESRAILSALLVLRLFEVFVYRCFFIKCKTQGNCIQAQQWFALCKDLCDL